MNIGNITNTGMDLNENGKTMQIEVYEKEIERLTNNWNELEEWVKQNSWYYNTSDGCQWVDQFKLLDKMNEIKDGNNE